jgi:PGF-CTERM protein
MEEQKAEKKVEKSLTQEEKQTEEKSPGFGIVGGVAGVILAIYLFKRR